jgi:4-alpha-glucanotransferase
MTSPTHAGAREAGVLVPLFSCPSAASWGIGEFDDVPKLAAWMRKSGLTILQLLPLNEMAPGQSSPYSALSSMALDPIFITVPAVADFKAMGGEEVLDADTRAALGAIRGQRRVAYGAVRSLKEEALRGAFLHFMEHEWARNSPRAEGLRTFAHVQSWWLDDYALFRALLHMTGGQDWREWPEDVRRHDQATLAMVSREYSREVLYRQYLQWLSHTQWEAARERAEHVRVFGDVSFMAATNSADAWAHQDLFSFDGTVGAPPDAFNREGQNWKLPVYRWNALRERQYGWFAQRAKRMSDLFDGFRVDHVVGLFRTWVFPTNGDAPHFIPGDEPSQIEQGRAVMEVFRQAGATVIAEDLGTIPDFVRDSLATMGIPGYKVMRWEKSWHAPGEPFIDPVDYPPSSLASSGTHDTETMAQWWAEAPAAEREGILALPSIAGRTHTSGLPVDSPYLQVVRDVLLELLYASGSDLCVLPIQDVFGWTDRVNVPGVIDEANWTWVLPVLVDHLGSDPEARERQQALARWAKNAGRG